MSNDRYRGYATFKRIILEDELLKNIFFDFCSYTITNLNIRSVEIKCDCNSVDYYEYVNRVADLKIINKSKDIIEALLRRLIMYGLIRYDIEKPYEVSNYDSATDGERIDYYENYGLPRTGCKLILTKTKRGMGFSGCSGATVYGLWLKDEEEEQRKKDLDKKFEETFVASVRETLEPDIKRISELAKETDKKLVEIEKKVNNHTVRNIEILSVFVAIMTFGFGGVISIANFEKLGIKGVLILNASVVICMMALFLMIELMIVRNKIEVHTMQNLKEIFIIFLLMLLCSCEDFWNWMMAMSI